MVDQQRKRSDPERESAQISRVECSRTGTEAKFRESKKRPSFRHQLLFRLTGEKWLKVKTSARLLGQNGRRVVSTDGMRFYFWNQQPSSEKKRGKKYLERSAEGCRGCAFCSGRLIICAASPTREPTQRDQTSEEETRCGRVKLTDQQTATRNASEESRNQKDQKFFFYLEGKKWREFFLLLFFQTDGCVIVASREKQRYVSRTCQHHNNVLWNQIHSTPNCLGLFAILFNSQKRRNNDD